MKKNYFTLILILFSTFFSFGQSIGDFQSKAIGPLEWGNATSWETWDGSLWVTTTSYPGQSSGAYEVTIQTGHSISITTNLITQSMGDVTVIGTLILGDGTSTQHDTTLSLIGSAGKLGHQPTTLLLKPL